LDPGVVTDHGIGIGEVDVSIAAAHYIVWAVETFALIAVSQRRNAAILLNP
jgi:hypothetical protein